MDDKERIIEERICRICAYVLDTLPQLVLNHTLRNILYADEEDVAWIVNLIEEEFSINLNDEEVNSVITVNSFVKIMRKKQITLKSKPVEFPSLNFGQPMYKVVGKK
ncbi:MAG: hypothetical protein ABIG60_04195 [Patescibacteria group bacterium]